MKAPRKAGPDIDIKELLHFFGLDEDFSDLGPENIAAIPQDQWEDCTQVAPPPAIQRYLDSDDILTNHTIDMMELAMEKVFGVAAPWFITCIRDGSEDDGSLAVNRFILMRDETDADPDALQNLIQSMKS